MSAPATRPSLWRSANPPLRDWRGLRVWVVGASSGIGEACAHAWWQAGAHVTVSARQADALQRFVDAHPADQQHHAVRAESGRMPEMSTSGGTSVARFISSHCPVVEFGLTGTSMHQVDEWCDIEEIRALERVYFGALTRFFGV